MGLFSVRWILQALGKEDFGLYSVVGSLIVFILFIGNTMAGSVQRFYAYAIGQGDPEEVKRWFNCAFVLHAGFAVVLVIVGVPIGNYLFDNVMHIPLARLETCRWVYYLSILGGVGTMLTTPYLGMFYARQRIFELTVWQTLQAVFMFALAFYLLGISGDLLFAYALGMVGIKLILDVTQILRACWLFDDCRLKRSYWFNKKRSTELTSYAGWNLFGTGGGVLRNQGMALLINVFSGAITNASFGIANQVSSQTNVISMAIYQAISPEIISREGAGERERMISLSIRANKFIVLLTLVWLIPFCLEIDYVLKLWLKDVPEHAVSFCRFILLTLLADKMSIGYWGAINAYGVIRFYQIVVGGLRMMTFPFAFCVFYFGGTPEAAVATMIIPAIAISLMRVLLVKKLMNIPISRWFNGVFVKSLYVFIPSIIIAILLHYILPIGFKRFIVVSSVTCFCLIIFSWVLALDKNEKIFINSKLKFALNKL